jgi:transcriptional regulator with GAF, ATPase, and Fis domain
VIGAATGIVMVRRRVSYAEGLSFLQDLSRQSELPLQDLAREIICASEPQLSTSSQSLTSDQSETWAETWPWATGALNAEGSIDELIVGRLLDLLVDREAMSDVLSELTELAVDLVPDCESASITLIHDGAAVTVAASDACARSLDEAQYSGGDGPCLQAARTDRVVRVEDFDAGPVQERAWRTAASGTGLTASMSLPVPTGRQVQAALNLHTVAPSGWTAQSLHAAQVVATYTGDALVLALRYSDPGDLLLES